MVKDRANSVLVCSSMPSGHFPLPFSKLDINNRYYSCTIDFAFTNPFSPRNDDGDTRAPPIKSLDTNGNGIVPAHGTEISDFDGLVLFTKTADLESTSSLLVQHQLSSLASKLFIIIINFQNEGEDGCRGISSVCVQADLCVEWPDVCVIDGRDEDWVDQVKQCLECYGGIWRVKESREGGGGGGVGFSEWLLDGIRAADLLEKDDQDSNAPFKEDEDLNCGSRGQEENEEEFQFKVDSMDETFQIISQIRDMMATNQGSSHNLSGQDGDDDEGWKRRLALADKLAKSFGLFDGDDDDDAKEYADTDA